MGRQKVGWQLLHLLEREVRRKKLGEKTREKEDSVAQPNPVT